MAGNRPKNEGFRGEALQIGLKKGPQKGPQNRAFLSPFSAQKTPPKAPRESIRDLGLPGPIWPYGLKRGSKGAQNRAIWGLLPWNPNVGGTHFQGLPASQEAPGGPRRPQKPLKALKTPLKALKTPYKALKTPYKAPYPA